MSNNKETAKPKSKSRRKFLVRGGLGTIGVLAVGTYVFRNPLRRSMLGMAEEMVPPYMGTGTEANLWLEVTSENKIILHSPKVEMGQGTFTSFAQIVADELDVDISQVVVTAAETSTGIVDGLSTGGSLSVAQLFQPLREMAATMRLFITNTAASKMGVQASSVSTENGILNSGNERMTYAEALEGITDFDLPDTPQLKPLSKYKYVGKPVPRVDLRAKVIGEPIFGMDAEMEGMVHATVIRPEHIASSIKSVEYAEVEKMPGVIQVVQEDEWVAIVAESFTQALVARRKVKVEWDIPHVWTEEELRSYLTVGQGNEMITQKEGSALKDEDEGVETMEFTSPIGAHAQIEPNGAVAYVKDNTATIKLSTQVIGVTQKQVAEALGFELENVNIIGTYLGGGFGRRLNTSHAVIAAKISRKVGRPVKYFFTRKEEFQNDLFRPPTHHIVKGKLTEDGKMAGLEHHYASGDVAYNSVIMPPMVLTMLGTDVGAMRGGNIMYDNVPNRRSVQWHKTLPFATSWWRSLGLLANTFAIECFIDEMAIKAKKNAVDFRLSMLGEAHNAQRIRNVIKRAAEISNYHENVSNGRTMGFAASTDAGSPCAQVVELVVKDKTIKVEKVHCVMDCGIAVNPDQVKAQCEGSIIMGLSATLHEKMTIKDGRLYPVIYGSYDMALMKDSPREINVELIQGVDKPLPVGEPPLGPIGAAIGNAVRRITGQRLTDLPLKLV